MNKIIVVTGNEHFKKNLKIYEDMAEYLKKSIK